MDQEELTARLRGTMTRERADKLASSLLASDFSNRVLIDLSFHATKEIGFRAAWILEQVYILQPCRFLKDFPYFIERFPAQHNPSARRHFAKIIVLSTERKRLNAIADLMNQLPLEEVVEALFSWLIDEQVAVAVKVHCMQALANLSSRYDWIKDELLETIRYLGPTESHGFFSRAKQIEKQLAK